jgi:hypothetical protein
VRRLVDTLQAMDYAGRLMFARQDHHTLHHHDRHLAGVQSCA